MDDLISRQAVIDLWDKYHPYIAIEAMEYDSELRALPSAQPERKKGKWMTVENPNYSPFDCSAGNISVCSVCGYAREQYDFNYCPNCGADMRGDEDAEIH